MDSKSTFRHSVRFRLTILLVIGVLILAAYFLVVASVNSRQQNNLYQSRLESRKGIFDSFVKSASHPLETFAYDYTFWDDMVDFIAGDLDVTWGEENIDPGLDTFTTDVVWAYNTKGEQVYMVATEEHAETIKDTVPANPADFPKIFKQNGVTHYFTKTENGIFEIYAATVHPTADDKRETPPRGYYFVGKHLSDEYLKAAGESIEGKVELFDSPSSLTNLGTEFNQRTGKIAFIKELKDFNDQTVGGLYATYVAADLRDNLITQDRLTFLGISTIFGLTLVLLFFISRWVIFPLKQVQASLTLQDEAPVASLKRKKDEFSEIAALISQSLWQRKQLESQNEIVEQQVRERTAQLSQEQARLQASINSLNAGFLMTLRDGRVAMYNPALLNMLGLSRSGSDQADAPLVSLEHLQAVLEKSDLVKAVNHCLGSGQPFEMPELNYQGRIFSIYGAPIREHSEVIGCVVLMNDITEQKIIERSKDEFFSIASHELRTPLTSIKGNSTMIMDYFPDIMKDDSLADMLKDIHESSERLIGIVNDFLDISSLEQGKMVFKKQEFGIAEAIESVVYEMQPAIKPKNIYLRFDKAAAESLPKVLADTNRTKQVVYNLVGNAIKFTEAGGGEVKTSLENNMVKVSISDTGRGIPQEAQSLLFHKFQQAGKSLLTRDTTKGTGLGLYISKMMVEKMGGRVTLESSEEGKGSTFSFSLPLSSPGNGKQPDAKDSDLSSEVDTETGLSQKPPSSVDNRPHGAED